GAIGGMPKSKKNKIQKVGWLQQVFKRVYQMTPAILSPLCLPIPPQRRLSVILAYFIQAVKAYN
ncbi:MAG: hypothetical protein J6J18_02730, partial [Oscillospiraceae bacterium]|nr:hypothetical protein [Oscillospiraceae bacterium]